MRGIKPKRNNWCTRKFLTTHWPAPGSAPSSDQPFLANFPQFIYWALVLWYGISLCPALLPKLTLGFMCTCPWAEHWTLKSPWLSEHWWAKISVCNQHYFQTYLHPKHSTVPTTEEEINSLPAKSRIRGFNINSKPISFSSQREKKETKSHLC